METAEVLRLVDELEQVADGTVKLSKTASRNNKSLAGDNPYGRKFHSAVVDISTIEAKLKHSLANIELAPSEMQQFAQTLTTLKNTKPSPKLRSEALKELRLFCGSTLRPKLEAATVNPIPRTESVLPNAVVKGAGPYFQRLILQANGCYEHGWYDACLVVVRKFFESLIIAVYEHHGKAAEIKGNYGEFKMLNDLANKVNAETTAWNLGRETKPALKVIQGDGNRSAHTRRYNAEKADVDKLIRGTRIAADELLHLANLK